MAKAGTNFPLLTIVSTVAIAAAWPRDVPAQTDSSESVSESSLLEELTFVRPLLRQRIAFEAFLPNPALSRVQISPNGRHVAAIIVGPAGLPLISVADADDLGATPVTISAPDRESIPRSLHWVSDGRLVISANRLMYFPRARVNQIYQEQQLFAVNADGSNSREIQISTRDGFSASQIGIVDPLLDDPEHALVTYWDRSMDQHQLQIVDIESGTTVLRPGEAAATTAVRGTVAGARFLNLRGPTPIDEWYLDRSKNPRIGQRIANGIERFIYIDPNSGEWIDLMQFEAGTQTLFRPIAFDEMDRDLAYVFSNDQEGRLGLYIYRCSTGAFEERLFAAPDDAQQFSPILSPDGADLHGIRYGPRRSDVFWLDRVRPDILRRADKWFRGWNIRVESASRGYERVVLYAQRNGRPARYYLYDSERDVVQLLGSTFSALEGKSLSSARTVHYTADDGTRLEGYLTLPPDVSDLENGPLPTVVMPHGTKEPSDFSQFDPLVQYFGNRGFAVLRLRYLRDIAYVDRFHYDWRPSAYDDVRAGTEWLIDQRIADPDRICIYGDGYEGGFVALTEAIEAPNLYRCVIAINPFTNLAAVLADLNRTARGLFGDAGELRDRSPENHASRISAAVFLAHDDSRRLAHSHAEAMGRALRRARIQYESIELSNDTNAEQYRLFAAMDSFIEAFSGTQNVP